MKTLKDIKISTSSTDDIEQMLIEQANLEYTEKLKILAREWIKEINMDIEKKIELGLDKYHIDYLLGQEYILKIFFNLEDEE